MSLFIITVVLLNNSYYIFVCIVKKSHNLLQAIFNLKKHKSVGVKNLVAGWEPQVGGNICIQIADSHRCTAETNITLKAIIVPLKINEKEQQ